ncbi:DUF2723 domain-containing protein [candidate division WOR-3 bacterium]|nr:DUF2723 domain-containing protein [candidate division WOR-3 bacterium]
MRKLAGRGKLPDPVVAVGAGLTALAAYLVCLCPTVGPGDSGELVLAALRLGIAHPPGYPMLAWLGRLATLLPLEPALAANLLGVLLAAGAVALTFLAGRRLGLSQSAAVAAALAFGLSRTFWVNATGFEVYGLSMLLLVATLLLAQIPSGLYAAAFLLGLCLAHQPALALALPALVALTWPALNRRRILPALLLLGLGFSASLGILFRALAGPEINWGDPGSLSRFWQHLTGSQYADLVLGTPAREFLKRLAGLPGTWFTELGLPAVLLALAGIAGLFRGERRLLLGLVLLLLTGLFGLAHNVPDYQPQLLPSLLALVLLAGAGINRLASLLRRGRTVLAAALGVVTVAIPLVANLPLARESRTTLVRDFGTNILLSLPEGATFCHSSDVTGNAVRYAARLQGRTDLTVVSVERLLSRTYWYQLQKGQPAVFEFDTALEPLVGLPRPERIQHMLPKALGALLLGGPAIMATDMLTEQFFAGPLMKEDGGALLPLGIVAELTSRSEIQELKSDDPPGNIVLVLGWDPSGSTNRRNESLWQRYELASARRTYRQPGLAEVQLTYPAARNNFGMFCLDMGWTDLARASLDSALALPSTPELRRVILRHRSRLPD